MESPKAEDVKFTVITTTEGDKVKVEWPVVYGAGGYQFSFYNVDDPDNPIAIGNENEVIDKCSVERDIREDTRYKVIVKALGNPKYDNKEAQTATEVSYSTLVPSTVIPDNTDLAVYFEQYPIPETADEIAYELVPGGNYTMSNTVNLGLTKLTLRGDKIHHAKLTLTGNGVFLSDGAGLKFKFIDVDCSEFTGNAVITYNSNQNPAAVSNGWVTIVSPVLIQSCKIFGLTKKLIHDSKKKYMLSSFTIKDCIIEQNTADKIHLIYIEGGIIKDLLLTNSTFYNKQQNSGYFIQYNNTRITTNSEWKDKYGWIKAGINITNCTFWQIVKEGQMGNYSGLAQKGNYIIVTNNIFVDCGKKEVIRRLTGGNMNMDSPRTFGSNSYWYDGAFVDGEISNNYDNSGTAIKDNPALEDPQNGNFTVHGNSQLENHTGDPRWLLPID